LIFLRYYLPGDKSGGPVRSIANIVDKLGNEFLFKIVTSDSDWTESSPYSSIIRDDWNQVGKAKVLYLSPRGRSFRSINKLVKETKYDVLYLNSFFDYSFTLKPLLARIFQSRSCRKPLIIAPRGEFSSGALEIKYLKKTIYLWVARTLGFASDAIWHASTSHEDRDIQMHYLSGGKFKYPSKIIIASDIASDIAKVNISRPNNSTSLKILYLSRITPKKNLHFALRVLHGLSAEIEFNIYGPHDNDNYWVKCRSLMKELPKNITVNYFGDVPHREVFNIFGAHDLFLFPTLGENYGHVVMESLSAGTPVLISNTTPWINLEKLNVGWDLPLSREGEFIKKIQYVSNLSSEDRALWRCKIASYAKTVIDDNGVTESNKYLFCFAAQLNANLSV
jgi:glycosyltransferase involved in cell wall biosynthesis